MDERENPFAPGAGTPPPELVGRDAIIHQANVLLARVKAQRSDRGVILTGLRGVGKTVLLNTIAAAARHSDYHCVQLEAAENTPLTEALVPQLRNLLLNLDRGAQRQNSLTTAMRALAAFARVVKFTYNDVALGFDIDPLVGLADSGRLEIDIPDLFAQIAKAAGERGTQIALFIDELQYLDQGELGSLIAAMHRLQQLQLPFVFIAAGLPTLPALAGNARSYAERLFAYPTIGALQPNDAKRALQEPVQRLNVKFDDDALDDIYSITAGYPYFIQEWGYRCWNVAKASPITRADVRIATPEAEATLDDSFFRVRFDRCTPGEKDFLRAMAELSPNGCQTGDLAKKLQVKVQSLGPRRASLIDKGMIYSPGHGELAFTVPLFDAFMKRRMPG